MINKWERDTALSHYICQEKTKHCNKQPRHTIFIIIIEHSMRSEHRKKDLKCNWLLTKCNLNWLLLNMYNLCFLFEESNFFSAKVAVLASQCLFYLSLLHPKGRSPVSTEVVSRWEAGSLPENVSHWSIEHSIKGQVTFPNLSADYTLCSLP